MGTVAGVIVGIVLIVAGVAKLTSHGWPAQARAIGAPPWAIRIVPVLEIVIGAGLVARVPYAGWAAFALLSAFTVFLVAALARGVKAPCACFGSMHARPVTWWTVVRNVALMALALVSLR